MNLDDQKNIVVTGSELRKIFSKIIPEGAKFSISKDYYWNIPSENLYDVGREPKKLNIGQISSDWEELEQLSNSDDVSIAFHDLDHLAAVLRAIADSM
jgi:hypothetical protein